MREKGSMSQKKKPLMNIYENSTYLQDSFTDMMDDPFFPIIRPIFPGGTFNTERISLSGT